MTPQNLLGLTRLVEVLGPSSKDSSARRLAISTLQTMEPQPP